MNNQRLQEFTGTSVGRLLWKYSLPSVVGMLVMALYNVVDRVFIGQFVGPDAIAGLAITFPLMNLATAVGVLVGVGASARMSITLGAGRPREAEDILGNTLVLTFINAFVYIAAFYVWLDPLLRAFGASDATLPYARDYILTLLPGLLLTNLAFGLNNLMRASGYPGRAMMTMLLGAVTNVVLDAVLIYWLDLGIRGAAVATDIAMAVSALFVIAHFMRPSVSVRFRRGIYRLKFGLILSIIGIGAAPAIVNAASCVVQALVNNSLAAYGTDRDIAAAGIMVTYTSLLVTIVIGMSQGMQPIVGYNYGAGKYHRLRRTYWLAVTVATVITTVGAIAGLAFPREIGRAFTDDAQLLDATERALSQCLVVFPVVGYQVITSCLFQSLGKVWQSILLGMLRQVLFLIPLLLLLPKSLGLDGVWLSFPSSDLLATVVATVMVILLLRRMPKADAGVV
ncbi:MAG: MATE family efflux transporter [Muribaculaceae bacterium]|nr:MATE family efflux transporter [Muribaculaceae bacterium]